MNYNLNEAKDLGVYKKLLGALGRYVGQFPATGLNPIFKAVVDRGMKVLPKDEQALLVLAHILSLGSDAAAVQALLNITFADLPLDVRPQYNDGHNNVTAYWGKNGKLFDRVMALLNTDANDKTEGWLDVNREKVKLVPAFVSDQDKARMVGEAKVVEGVSSEQAVKRYKDQIADYEKELKDCKDAERCKKIRGWIADYKKLIKKNESVSENGFHDTMGAEIARLEEELKTSKDANRRQALIHKIKQMKQIVANQAEPTSEGKLLNIAKKPEDQIQALVEGDGTEFEGEEDYVQEMGITEALVSLTEVERFLINKAESEENREDPLVQAAQKVLEAENILQEYVKQQGGK